MKFWDTSAIVPLCVEEPYSHVAREILTRDTGVAVWWGTRIEWTSAVMRQVREDVLTPRDEQAARRILRVLMRSWIEVQPSEDLRNISETLLSVHPLRAADVMQLAAAIQWSQGSTLRNGFVSFDRRLREAARSEGFIVLPEVF